MCLLLLLLLLGYFICELLSMLITFCQLIHWFIGSIKRVKNILNLLNFFGSQFSMESKAVYDKKKIVFHGRQYQK